MFERFTEPARAVLVEAKDVAVELDSGCIDVGHILYGCAEGREETAGQPLRDCGISVVSIRNQLPRGKYVTRPGGQVDPDALRAIGIEYEEIQAAVAETFGPRALEHAPDRRIPATGRKPPFTIEAKRSLEQALRVAVELHHDRMAPGHILLGLLRLDNDFVSSTIEQSGTTRAALSAEVLRHLEAAS
jgi:ATP-dependent Clp protease ATP-binding subunit ClpA